MKSQKREKGRRISLNLSPTTTCWNSGLELDPGDFELYKWNNYTIIDETGNYSVPITDIKGCKNYSDTINITVVKPNQPEIYLEQAAKSHKQVADNK